MMNRKIPKRLRRIRLPNGIIASSIMLQPRLQKPLPSRILAVGMALAFLLPTSALAQIKFRQLNREVIENRLQSYSRGDAERAAIIKRLFAESGCADKTSEQKVRRGLVPNIICVLPGQTKDVIVVGAHTDHVWKGSGVVDNWSGAAL